jgi:crossover junction endodeoxyribonuclease RuvC
MGEQVGGSRLILGIDPGTRVSGYGLLEVNGRNYAAIDYGCIRPPSSFKLSERYLVIFRGVDELIEKYRPHAVVVETQYVNKNAQSAIKLGMARGAVLIAAKNRGLPVFEYAPTNAKKAIGNGRASKHQVQAMVQSLLSLLMPPPEDAADALALAICHSHTAAHLINQFEI